MKQQITRLSPHQNGKVAGAIMAVVSLPMIVLVHLLVEYSRPETKQSGGLLEFPLFMYFLMPLIYFAIAYTSVALACVIYNALHKFIGGIEFERAVLSDPAPAAQRKRQRTTGLAKRILPLALLLGVCALIISQMAQDGRVAARPEGAMWQQVDCGSIYGIDLPCWDIYLADDGMEGKESLPHYPYAKRPNGCSFPGAVPGTNDLIKIGGLTISFTDICNDHDRCYYTLGTTAWQCNSVFQNSLRTRCLYELGQQTPDAFDILTLGISREEVQILCGVETMIIAGAVIGTQDSRHQLAQERQVDYLARVARFVQEKLEADRTP